MSIREKYNQIAIAPEPKFADAIPVIYAPMKEYVIKVIPLMLEHIWQRMMGNNTAAFEELLYNGWICRLITLDTRVLNRDKQNEIPGWPAVREKLINSIDECKDETQLLTMTDHCMGFLRPVLDTRFEENYRFPKRKFHCWWYTIHDDDAHMALHLVNAYQPQSPFENLNHFLSTMLEAVEHGVNVYPSIEIVSCGSWLNGLKKFQSLWPASFCLNQKVLNESAGFGPGTWGQYMTTAGGFNEQKATILRETGKHPFALTEAQSPIKEVMAHLKQTISVHQTKGADE